ncbi:MAG: efflux RND transporter periplasmic adaptor subunit [Cyanophyceae cyanobacterium]
MTRLIPTPQGGSQVPLDTHELGQPSQSSSSAAGPAHQITQPGGNGETPPRQVAPETQDSPEKGSHHSQWVPAPPAASPVRKKRHPWRWGIGILILLGLGGGGYAIYQQMQQQAASGLLDLTITVREQDLSQRLRVSGQVQPIRQVNVSPREAGIIAELFADQGDQVQAGQLLARMDYGNLTAGVVQAQAQVAEAQARLALQMAGEQPEVIAAAQSRVESAQAQVNQAQLEVQRYTDLANQGAIPRNDLDQFQTTLQQRQASLQEAQQDLARLQSGTRVEAIQQTQAQIQQAQAQLQQQQSRLADTEVRAPFGGIVTQRFAVEGAFVAPTTTASDSTAASSSSILALAEGIEIRSEVPEAQINQIFEGQPVEIRASAYPDRVVRGQVNRIPPSTVVVREVTTFRVIVDPIEAADFLRIGMNVSVDFLGESLPAVLTIPSVALVTQDGEQGVIQWDPSTRKPIFQQVTTGVTQQGSTQVLTGLATGDRIFTSIPPGVNLEQLINQSREE